MQAAALLSDLKSLSVCSHEAALKLVSVHQNSRERAEVSTNGDDESSEDVDLARTEELVYLHTHVKLQHIRSGLDQDLLRARQEVNRILMSSKKPHRPEAMQ